MLMLATLQRSGGLDALSRKLDLPPPTIQRAALVGLPVIANGFRQLAGSALRVGQGHAVAMALLAQWGGAGLALDVLGPEPLDQALGQRALEQLLGSAEAVEWVVMRCAREANIALEAARSLLAGLLLLLAGYVAARLATVIAAGQSPEEELEQLLLSVGPAPAAQGPVADGTATLAGSA